MFMAFPFKWLMNHGFAEREVESTFGGVVQINGQSAAPVDGLKDLQSNSAA
jgi:hypothetical protein